MYNKYTITLNNTQKMSCSIFNKNSYVWVPMGKYNNSHNFTQKLLIIMVQRFIIKFKNIQFFNQLCQDNKHSIISHKNN